MRHVIPISGKDSLATAFFQSAYEPDRDYEYLFCDVGTELPETYEWLDEVEDETGWSITRVGRSLIEMIDHWDQLPSHKRRFCTREGKIKPMEEYLGEDEATIYYGLRADEDRPGYRARSDNLNPEYPLRELGIDLEGVYRFLEGNKLLPPQFFWPALHDAVTAKIGSESEWEHALHPWDKRVLFAGRSRSNCFFCFYQRQYEFIWLLDEHPDLYDRAQQIEETTGGDEFTWRGSYTLRELRDRKDEIIDRRARVVAQKISEKTQGVLFEETSRIDQTSCGMFCGK